ncbi:MAG: hypothetical protein ACRCWG_11850 [Sarcina sp.]
MKIKRLILVTMALASSVFTIGAALYHQSVKNERVKIEILEGDLKLLEDERLAFFNNNGLSTENIVEVSSSGMNSSTKRYNDLNYINLSPQNNSRGFLSDEFRKDHKELYEYIDKLGQNSYYIDYKYVFTDDLPYIGYIQSNNDKYPENLKFTFKLAHYTKDNKFEEKSLELDKSDFSREKLGELSNISPITIYKENDNLIKLIVETSIVNYSSNGDESSFDVYDYIEIDLSNGKYKSQNIDLYAIESASIGKNNLYVLGHPGNDEVIRKFDINDFNNTEDLYSNDKRIRANSKNNILSRYSKRYLNIFDNRFEIIDIHETTKAGLVNLTTIDVSTSEIKEHENIPALTKSEVAGSNIIDAFTSEDKLYISYTNENVFDFVDGKSFLKVIDINTGKTLLKLQVNIGSNVVSRVIE